MIEKAIAYAKLNPVDDLPPLAAIITYKNKIVAVGYNQRKTHTLQKRYAVDHHKIYLHAEIDALRKVKAKYSNQEIADMSIYIARISKNGEPALAKPCPGCLKALHDHKITIAGYSV